MAEVALAMGALWSAAAVLVPTVLRWAIDRGESGVPFVTYFPAVLLAALFLGWRWGAVVALASALVANWLFVGEPWHFSTSPLQTVAVLLFVLTCVTLVWIGEVVRRQVRELEAAKAREELLNAELMHRVKNMLATVNAMAVLTARHCEPGQFAKAFSGRMMALDKATELLGAGHNAPCNVRKLVESATEPFRILRPSPGSGPQDERDSNFVLEGPHCELPRDACVPLALALHELCTNAAKHGALTAPEGRVELAWACDDEGMLTLRWRECGGPPVPPAPSRTGMGTQLLRRQRGLESVEVRFEPAGLECEITIAGVAPA